MNIRADTQVRPYNDNAVEMVRHDDIFIDFPIWKFAPHLIPPFLHHPPRLVQPHRPVHHLAEQARLAPGTHGHEIRTFLGVIVSRQPDGFAVVSV
jgi:hypothetical protein